MNQDVIDKNKDKPIDEIMKISEIYLVEPISSERYGITEKFIFTFSISGFTDPEWREIFTKNYNSDKAKFSGSQFILTCKSEELEKIVNQVKPCISLTNKIYKEKKEELIEAINKHNSKEIALKTEKKEEEINVKVMFKNFKI